MKFKDNATGNIVEFTYEHDIVQMLVHPQYTKVEDEVKVEPVKKETKAKE